MISEQVSHHLERLVAIGLPAVSLLVVTGKVTDPVNAPKFLLLGGIAVASVLLCVSNYFGSTKEKLSIFNILLFLFAGWSLVVSVLSKSPFSQNMYGLYGRNTGFLTYLFLIFILFSITHLKAHKQIKNVLVGFGVVVILNLIYGLWVKFFGDFIAWSNPYKALLGTFGNPNFISAFFGMAIGPLFAMVLKGNLKVKFVSCCLLLITFFELFQADSLQGFIVSAVSIWLVTTAWASSVEKGRKFSLPVFGIGAATGVVAVIGALGSGPLARLVEQPTVTLRQQYWYAAWKMGLQNPFFGVGMDSYGDWYRRARGAKSLINPGPETVTNVAHNVYLDIFAYGGFPLFVLYIAIMSWSGYLAFKLILTSKDFDLVSVSVAVIFLAYQIQSIISINQIGLAVWGWASAGLLIALDRIQRSSQSVNSKGIKKSVHVSVLSPQLVTFLGFLLGLLISCPPVSADMKWANALKSSQLTNLENSLENRYLSPNNSLRMAQAVETLERSNLHDFAIKYARQGVIFNPQSFNAWQMLYYSKNASSSEKARARDKMMQLDPLNPKWKKLS